MTENDPAQGASAGNAGKAGKAGASPDAPHLLLYGAQLSPFVRKAEAFMREKGVPFEQDPVSILPMPDWFAEFSPARRIPVLRNRAIGASGMAGTIPDSSAICAYIERLHPEPALYPAEPFDYARAVWLEEYCDTELALRCGAKLFRSIMFARFQKKEPDLSAAKEAWNEDLPPVFDYLESQADGREWFCGDALSIADLSLGAVLSQATMLAGPIDAARWPALSDLFTRVTSRPSFAANLAVCRKLVGETLDLSA